MPSRLEYYKYEIMQGRHNVAALFGVGISSQAAQYCFVPAARYPINPLQGRQAAVWGSGRASSLWCVPRARYYRHVTIVAYLRHADSREPIAAPHCAHFVRLCEVNRIACFQHDSFSSKFSHPILQKSQCYIARLQG